MSFRGRKCIDRAEASLHEVTSFTSLVSVSGSDQDQEKIKPREVSFGIKTETETEVRPVSISVSCLQSSRLSVYTIVRQSPTTTIYSRSSRTLSSSAVRGRVCLNSSRLPKRFRCCAPLMYLELTYTGATRRREVETAWSALGAARFVEERNDRLDRTNGIQHVLIGSISTLSIWIRSRSRLSL